VGVTDQQVVDERGGARSVGEAAVPARLAAPGPVAADVILAGDVCYDPDLAEAMTAFLRAQRRFGVDVLVGDPHRPYLPKGLTVLARYDVPGTGRLEERAVTPASVLSF